MEIFRETICLTHDGALKAVAAGVARRHDRCAAMSYGRRCERRDPRQPAYGRGTVPESAHRASKGAYGGVDQRCHRRRGVRSGTSVGIASQGGVTNLPGGLPIRFDGRLAGGVGVGSGTGEQDFDVARAALAAIGADVT